MKSKTFFSNLLLTTLSAIIFVFIIRFIPGIKPFEAMGWSSVLFFVAWSLLMFYTSNKAAKDSNKNIFTSAILGFTFGKMIFAFIFVVAWAKIIEPSSKLFLVPFLGVYLIYTIFETHFMMKLGKSNMNEQQ